MDKPKGKNYAFILGSHPALSYLELERQLDLKTEGNSLKQRQNVAFYTTAAELDATELMERLGGTIKIIEVIGEYDAENISDWLFDQVDESSKFHFGFSLYAVDPGIPVKKSWKTLHSLGLSLKKVLKADGISCRYVQSREVVLSSVIVHKERLLKNGVEIVLLKGRDGIQYGRTLAVQPFQKFSKRDYGRPKRDHRSGMLPPKLARMMLNIAAPNKNATILDPFCGSGTVIQEALLLGYKNIIGTDASKQAIEDTRENLNWLKIPHRNVSLHVQDILKIDKLIETRKINCVVAEGYLGKTTPNKLEKARTELRPLYSNGLKSISKTLAPGARLVMALPAWKGKIDNVTLNIEAEFAELGYTEFHKPIFYGRPQAIVLRHIYFLEFKG